MNSILAVATSGGGSDLLDIIGFIAIPLFIALVTGTWAIVKGLMRFTQFMARSEATNQTTANSNIEIRDNVQEINTKLQDFAEKTNLRLGQHDQMLAVLNYVIGRNGNLAARTNAQGEQAVADADRIRHAAEDDGHVA